MGWELLNHETKSLTGTGTLLCILAVVLVTAIIFRLVAFQLNSRRGIENSQGNEAPKKKRKKRNPERRKRFISKLIETRTITKGVQCEECTIKVQALESSQTCIMANVITSDDNNGCPICLDTFEEGQDLSWSQEQKCHHIFHAECLEPWLMKHDDCPCCRVIFIDESVLLEDEEGVIVVPKESCVTTTNRGRDENV